MLCHICGEDKKEEEFKLVPYFRKYNKHRVCWCKECQKMYITMKKEKRRLQIFLEDETKFTVSFD